MRKLHWIGLTLLVLAVGGVAGLWGLRAASTRAEARERHAEVSAGPSVKLVRAEKAPPLRTLTLQGEARPFLSVTLYAKVSGYLKTISVDKGDRVQKGQTVAIIDSPELDRLYDAAAADAKYKRAEAARTASLAGPGVVSARQADLDASQAHVADAQVRALDTQKSYQTLLAPFSGTVTARFADPGALVQSAANAQTSALPVVTIAQIDRLRVYVYVAQREASSVKEGDAAEVRAGEIVRRGQVARLSRELDAKTRMMLVEIDLDNRDGAIVPGSFVEVKLQIAAPAHVELPVGALIIRDNQALVPVVKDGIVHLRKVTVAEHDGKMVRFTSGIEAGELAALDLGGEASEGARVRPIENAK